MHRERRIGEGEAKLRERAHAGHAGQSGHAGHAGHAGQSVHAGQTAHAVPLSEVLAEALAGHEEPALQ